METETLDILVLDDDASMRTMLADGLAMDGHRVVTARSCTQARRLLRERRVGLLLLDLNLPDASGYVLLRELREPGGALAADARRLPVIVLSGRSAEVDKLRGFELGCDDFLVKPYSFAELRGRIAAVMRRSAGGGAGGEMLVAGELTIDLAAREVSLDGRVVPLTTKEYGLLLYMAAEPLRVFTKTELLRGVWGHRDAGSTRTLDSHACRLRRKLGGTARRYVVNVWGVGYRLLDGVAASEGGE